MFNVWNKYFISRKFNEPDKPNNKELPNNNKPFEIPPKTKYLTAASIAIRLWYVIAANVYKDKLAPSKAKYAVNKSKADNKHNEKNKKNNIGINISICTGSFQINLDSTKILINIKKNTIKNLQIRA